MKNMKQFLRIANARLRKLYPNKMQRKAWAANMWRRYVERQNIERDLQNKVSILLIKPNN